MRIFLLSVITSIFLPVICLAGLATNSFADPKPQAEKPALEQIKPLSKKQIRELKKSMPDFNMLMSGMMETGNKMADNEDMIQALQNAGEIIEKKLGPIAGKNKEAMPDINALMDAMIELAGDEEFVGEIKQGLEPMLEMAGELQNLAEKAKNKKTKE